jgi:hypothetical protein
MGLVEIEAPSGQLLSTTSPNWPLGIALTRSSEVFMEVTWGSYWISPRPDLGLLIFGHVFTEQEVIEDERRCGADEDEAAMTLRNIVKGHHRGTMYVRAYSTVVEEGEIGFAPRAMCLPLTEEQFEEARSHKWNPRVLIESNWLKDILLDAAAIYLE